jgi:biotin transport system substrate-specific component
MLKKRAIVAIKELSLPNERSLIQAFWVFTFALLTAVGSQVEIPNQPVPFTFQTFFVLLSGALLGKRAGAASMGLYIALGAVGLPLFSGGTFGLARIVGPTGGYLLSFPIAAFVVGYLVELRSEYWWMIISMFVGLLLIFSLGTLQLYFVYFHNWMNSFQAGFLIFSWWDMIKLVGAATIAHYYFRKVKCRK